MRDLIGVYPQVLPLIALLVGNMSSDKQIINNAWNRVYLKFVERNRPDFLFYNAFYLRTRIIILKY